MAKSADIVFAPYNYILDPFIATQRELDLSGNVSQWVNSLYILQTASFVVISYNHLSAYDFAIRIPGIGGVVGPPTASPPAQTGTTSPTIAIC